MLKLWKKFFCWYGNCLDELWKNYIPRLHTTARVSRSSWPISCHQPLPKLPENIRKPLVIGVIERDQWHEMGEDATIRIQQLSSKRNRKAKVQIFNVVWFFDPFPYYCLIDTWLLNPFLANVSILYPLKTPENLWFSGVFRG